MEQGKTVMAVPGNITSPTSEGTNNLIKSGAVPVTDADDIFFALKISPAGKQAKPFNGTLLEETVYSLIKEGVSDQEELVAAARTDSPTLSGTLTMLEISGYIRPAGGGSWVIA
jgi:DNA processing protein